jgi:hypothetical protein
MKRCAWATPRPDAVALGGRYQRPDQRRIESRQRPRLALRWLQSHARLLKSADTEEELRRTLRSAKLALLLARGAYGEALLRLIEKAEPVSITAHVQA